jgi:hypothetical protein
MKDMDYRRIYYREDSDAGITLEFQINFVMREGSICYLNNAGGYTIRGAKLGNQELEHVKLLLDKGKPERYRTGLPTENGFLKMDDLSWELAVDYTDGTPELRIGNRNEENLDENKIYTIPALCRELRNYALAKLGLEDTGKVANK